MKKKIFIGLSILILAILTGSFWLWKQNQGVIIDLGNGWSSYSNKKIGITVKIPSDAEIEAKREYESFTYGVNFSKGPVKSVNNITTLKYFGRKERTYDEKVQDFRKETEEKSQWSEIADVTRTRTRYFSREIKIDNRSVFLDFQEAENLRKKEKYFNINNVLIPGEKGFYTMGLNGEEFYNMYPEIKKAQNNEEYMIKSEEAIRDLIISINEDNF